MRLTLKHPAPWRVSLRYPKQGLWEVYSADDVVIAGDLPEAEARLLAEAPNLLYLVECGLADPTLDQTASLRQCVKRVRSPVGGRGAGAKGR